MKHQSLISATAMMLLSGVPLARAEVCPPVPGFVGEQQPNTLWLDVGDGYSPTADIKEISKAADNLHWDARWFKLEVGDNLGPVENPDWNSVRIILDPRVNIVTIRLETNPLRVVSGPVVYTPGTGFTYVQSRVPGRLSVCVKLPGFTP